MLHISESINMHNILRLSNQTFFFYFSAGVKIGLRFQFKELHFQFKELHAAQEKLNKNLITTNHIEKKKVNGEMYNI